MLDSEIVAVAKNCVAVLNSVVMFDGWAVSRRWSKKTDIDAQTLTGKHMHVWHGAYNDNGSISRDKGLFSVTLYVSVAERYNVVGEVPDSWIDERVNYVQNNVFDVLSSPGWASGLKYWTEAIAIPVVCDPDFLRTYRLFWSELEVTLTRER